MPAFKPHKTKVSKDSKWNASKAFTEAKNEPAMLVYMHAWQNGLTDHTKRGSYLFEHHMPGTDTPAIIEGVNLALVRLKDAQIPADDKPFVERHLRMHRLDAGLSATMSEGEINEALIYLKDVNDLKRAEVEALRETVRLQEKSNLAEWLESRLHLSLTQIADDMFGGGNLNRNERKTLSGAIGAALDSYHAFVKENAPQLFDRRPWEEAPEEDSQDVSESLKEIALNESAIALEEKAVRSDGTVPIKIIQPGWGSSGYYPKEVLRRDGPKAFRKGTKMNWDHPTEVEEAERPEGSLNNLASELVSDARWMDKGPKGPGLYADAKVFEAYQGAVNDLAPHIGVSIHARGKAMRGEAEGMSGAIIQEIFESPFNRVDYVTMPGAGGEIISLFEAARMVRVDNTKAGAVPAGEATDNVANHNSDLEEGMDVKLLEEQVATLQTSNQTLTTHNARLSEALAIREAKDMVREALGNIDLPMITKTRLIEQLAKNPPMKDGLIDKGSFAAAIAEAVKTETKYLESVLGKGQIRGMGPGDDADNAEDDGDDKLEESLAESFGELGLSETGAKIAAKGRR